MSTIRTRDLLAEINELPELVPMPAIALKLLTACKDENVGAKELCKIVSCDSSMSVRLLHVSNSSMYGCAGQIKTLEHASVVLGMRGLRDLAVSIVAAGMFQDNKDQHSSAEMLWRHSLACATVAKTISEDIPGVCPDEAFICGIIHDVGKLVLMQLLGEEYTLIPKALAGESTAEEEESLYGICHVELGTQCTEDWGLSCDIAQALCYHHAPNVLAEHPPLSAVISAANQLAKIWNVGTDVPVVIDIQNVVEKNQLPFDEEKLVELKEQSLLGFDENERAFAS